MNSASEKIEDAFFKRQDQELIENLRKKRKTLTLTDAIASIEGLVLHNNDDGNTKAALKLIKSELQKNK
jgi:hypothetical protein